MRVFLNKVYSVLQASTGEDFPRLAKELLLAGHEHFRNLLDFFGVLEDLVQKHRLHFEVGEVAEVTSRQDRLFGFEVFHYNQAVLLHHRADGGVVNRPND